MVANTLLEIYTIIFSWTVYEAIWDVLTGTGLALVPFIAAIISSMKEGFEHGDSKSAMRRMETSLIGIIVVLIFCVIPWKGWGMQVSTVKYDISIPDCNMSSYSQPPTTGNGDSTGTAFDSTFPELGGIPAYRPVAWSLVELLSTAITHTTIKSISCVNNYNYMLLRVGSVHFEDDGSGLNQRVTDFYQSCYLKALEAYNAAPTAPPTGLQNHHYALFNTDWIGAYMFTTVTDRYYRDEPLYMKNMEQYGFHRQAAIRKSDQATTFGANPYCHEVWLGETGPGVVNSGQGLRDALLNAIPRDSAGSIREAWDEWGYQVLSTGAIPLAQRQDLLLKLMLQADSANINENLNVDLSGNMDVATSKMGKVAEWFSNVLTAGTSAVEVLSGLAMIQILKSTGPLMISMIQFVIIISAPFVMVLSGYKFKTFMMLGMAYFGFEFINAIWAFTFWFDQKLIDLYMSSAGWIANPDYVIIYGVMTASLPLLLPVVWLTVYGFAATGMVRAMGVGGAGGGASMGGGGVGSAVRGIGRLIDKARGK
jgi:hypothetical protein